MTKVINGLVLASASPRRLDLLQSINIIPELVQAADIDESYKKTSIIKCSKLGIKKIGQAAINLANYEGLQAHALSIKTRLNKR